MKTALVTGANSGIGYSTVKLFLTNGYRVFAHFNSAPQELNSITDNNLILLKADFSKLNETEDLFNQVLMKTDTIDVLVNNAGLYHSVDDFSELDLEIFNKVMNVNLKSPFLLSKRFIELMKKFNRGRIINISSIGVKYGGSPNSMPYTVSKSALEAMTLSFSKEGAKYNILVNALRVGVTNTKIHNNSKGKNMKNRIEMIPLKRMAEASEIAEYILFLASEKSNFTTGSIITVAGGE